MSKNKYKAHFINFRKIVYDFLKWSGWPLFFFFRIKKVYENKAAKKHVRKGALVISNHVLYSDPMVLHCAFWYRRLHFVVMKEIMDTKFRTWLYTNGGCIPIDREKFSLSSLRVITEMLKGGNMIAIFPEGHVSLTNEAPMGSFKSGMVLMAIQADVPIIPVYRELREHKWQRQKVAIGEPIYLKDKFGEVIGMKQIEEITEYLFKKEEELKSVYHRKDK